MPETLTMIRGGGSPRIAADDNVAMRELIALVLRSRGFDVVVASDGEAALAAILSDGAGVGLHPRSNHRSASGGEGVAGARLLDNTFVR